MVAWTKGQYRTGIFTGNIYSPQPISREADLTVNCIVFRKLHRYLPYILQDVVECQNFAVHLDLWGLRDWFRGHVVLVIDELSANDRVTADRAIFFNPPPPSPRLS